MTKPQTRPTIEEVASCLKAGGVVLLPTDTVLGLAAAPYIDDAVQKLYQLKMRPLERRLPIMIASPSQLESLGAVVTPAATRLLDSNFVPGPLTVALGLGSLKPIWLAERYEIAVRIPADDFMLGVLRQTGPLFVTSANAHGHPSPSTHDQALAQLNGVPDLIVQGKSKTAKPSSLVNCNCDPPVVEREGEVPTASIRAILG